VAGRVSSTAAPDLPAFLEREADLAVHPRASMSVTHTSPSPSAACASPQLNSAPSTSTDR
jgi:hypothetical protein